MSPIFRIFDRIDPKTKNRAKIAEGNMSKVRFPENKKKISIVSSTSSPTEKKSRSSNMVKNKKSNISAVKRLVLFIFQVISFVSEATLLPRSPGSIFGRNKVRYLLVIS